MTIYYIIIAVLFIFALLERIDFESQKYGILIKRMLFYSAVLLIVLFGGLRYEVGFDYESYRNIYNQYDGSLSRFEPGYCLFMHIFKFIFHAPFPYFLFYYTLVNILIKVIFFQRYFKYPCLLIFLYFTAAYIGADFGVMRNGMATGIILWTIPAIQNRKLWWFLVIWLAAVSFHYSALIFFPMYWLAKIRISPKVFLILLFAGFIFIISGIPAFIFKFSANFFPGTFGDLLRYMSNYGIVEENLLYFLRPSTLIAIVLILFYGSVEREEIADKSNNSLEFSIYNVYAVFFLLIKFLSSVEIMQRRGAYYYKLIEIFLFYFLLNKIKEKEGKVIFIVLLFVYGALRIFAMGAQEMTFNFYKNYRFFSEFLGF